MHGNGAVLGFFFPILVGEWPLQSFSSSVLLPPEGFSLAGPGFQLSVRSLGGLSCSFLWPPPVLDGDPIWDDVQEETGILSCRPAQSHCHSSVPWFTELCSTPNRDFPSKCLWKLLSHKKRAAEGASVADGSCEVPRRRSQGKLPGAAALPRLREGRRNFWDSVSVALILTFNSHPSCFPRVGACGRKPP